MQASGDLDFLLSKTGVWGRWRVHVRVRVCVCRERETQRERIFPSRQALREGASESSLRWKREPRDLEVGIRSPSPSP